MRVGKKPGHCAGRPRWMCQVRDGGHATGRHGVRCGWSGRLGGENLELCPTYETARVARQQVFRGLRAPRSDARLYIV